MAYIGRDGEGWRSGVYLIACVVGAKHAGRQNGGVAARVNQGAAIELQCIGVDGNAVGVGLTRQYGVAKDQICGACA